MGRRGKELSPQMRARICELHSIRWSYDKIHAKHPEIPRSTIADTCRKERLRVNNVSQKRCGAPRVISEDEREALFEAITLTPEMTHEALQAQEAPNASVRSIKRLLQEMNIRKWKRLKRPALTQRYATARLNWAQRYRLFSYLNWRRVRWSDECSVEIGKGRKLEWVFVKGGPGQLEERLKPNMVQPKPCGKQSKKMFWATFGYGVRSALVPMDGDPNSARGGVTARVYRQVLDEHLLGILQFGSIFMQDNAPIHTAHIIRDWLQEKNVEVMEWPPYSSDLNPIENLWALLKAEMYRLYPELIGAPKSDATVDLLIRCAVSTWASLEEEMLNTLIDTMTHRVAAVLGANGWYTKY